MNRTLVETPVLRSFFKWFSLVCIALIGWRLEGEIPRQGRCVLIVAPHTSNWDFVLGLLFMFAYQIRVTWMGKNTIFSFPFGRLMRWMGGLPIDRSKHGNVVNATVQVLRNNEKIMIAMSPEGTRKKVEHWKTGFYWMAHGADVPIVPCYMDYRRRVVGFGQAIRTGGDIEAELPKIQAFYHGVTPKNPDQF